MASGWCDFCKTWHSASCGHPGRVYFDRTVALEAENAALKAERDAYRSQFWDNALPELTEMRKQRDDARAAFNVMDGCYKQAVAERDSETRWAHHYFTAWQTARQSRARLVRLVRYFKRVTGWAKAEHANAVATIESLQAERDAEKERHANNHAAWTAANEELRDAHQRALNECAALKAKRDDYWARVGVMTDAYLSADNELASARQSRARLVNAVREQRELLKAARLIRAELRQEVADLTTEADAARAWAAAWREAATRWRKVHLMPVTLTFEHHVDLSQFSIDRRALRRAERITSARRAAEAMERR